MTRAPAARADFWAGVKQAAAEHEHACNLRGKTRVKCTACGGTGNREPSRVDYDAHGSYYVPADPCRTCGGEHSVEVACSTEVEAAAVQREIDKLKARMRELKRRARKVSAAGAEEE